MPCCSVHSERLGLQYKEGKKEKKKLEKIFMVISIQWVGVQPYVYKEQSSGLSTQPCGESVLSVMVEES